MKKRQTKMDLKECKKLLGAMVKSRYKEGYKYDAADTMFRIFVLEMLEEAVELLEKIANKKTSFKKREPSKYNLHIASERAKGKSLKESIESWQKRQTDRGNQ